MRAAVIAFATAWALGGLALTAASAVLGAWGAVLVCGIPTIVLWIVALAAHARAPTAPTTPETPTGPAFRVTLVQRGKTTTVSIPAETEGEALRVAISSYGSTTIRSIERER